MKKETYYCDLCKEEKTPDELLALFFDGSKYILTNQGQNHWSQSHKHICKKCVKLIKEASS